MAHASPARQPFLAGEHGPELVIPGNSGGTVLTASATARMGRGGTGAVYNIDARGSDEAAFARLETVIRNLNGSIERRAVGAVISARSRGGSLAAALG